MRLIGRRLGFWVALLASRAVSIAGLSGRQVLILGDSHVRPLQGFRRRLLTRGYLLVVVSVSGATASGMPNPHSNTGARLLFDKALRAVGRDALVLVGLGEVDAGFLVHTKGTDRETVRAATIRAFSRYETWLLGVRASHPRLGLIGSIPPTVEDYSDWRGLGGARSAVHASLERRLEETLYWNRCVADLCRDHEMPWIDVASPVLTEDGRVASSYRSKDQSDHHLSGPKYRELVAQSGLLPGLRQKRKGA